MSERFGIMLKHFYIYSDLYGKTEGNEEQKILYYFPHTVNLDDKMKNVGLSEAIIQFTETFNMKQSSESLHTQQSRHYYYQPESHFFMVMTVSVPRSGGVEGTCYHGQEVKDSVCLAVVRLAYQMYKLFHNTFSSTIKTSHLKEKLESFFNKYLETLKLENCDIMDVFQGVQFLPLDKQTFLHVQCFVNHLEALFPDVELTAFLFNDRLIWSGLELEDMQVVFQFLVYSLLPKHSETESTASSYGRFITGPQSVYTSVNNVGNIPKLYLSHAKAHPHKYQIVVYKAAQCTMCLFLPDSVQLTMESFRKWDMFLGPRLTKLVTEVSTYTSRQSSMPLVPVDALPRFVYFNRMNLATKSTIHLDSQRSGNTAVTPQILRILADINAQHSRTSEAMDCSEETIMKTMTDYWVVGKLSNAREFYVVIQQKNANLIEINDEVKKICENELKSIFFHV